MVDISIIIPARNEAGRIGPHLTAITQYFHSRATRYEILVVDDGSTDDTGRIAQQFENTILLRHPVSRGKGAAVRTGMKAATGKLCLFTDADGATKIEEIERLELAIREGAGLAIGSRRLAMQRDGYTVRIRWHRRVLSVLFSAIVRHTTGILGVGDTQCGFKLFRRDVAQDLFNVGSIEGYGFDLELLYIAQLRGYRIAEVPVNWADQPGSKIRLTTDSLAILRELAIMRRNAAKGYYEYQGEIREHLLPELPSHSS